MRILGIDPGSRITGYGVIDVDGNRSIYVASGCVKISEEHIADRLRVIYEGIQSVLHTHQPDEMAIEKVFMHRNADSALKLGQARGAAICAVANACIPISEYSATQIKQSVVGKGHAQKHQVQHMVKVLLNLQQSPQADAADALAVALSHIHTGSTLRNMQGVSGTSRGRFQTIK